MDKEMGGKNWGVLEIFGFWVEKTEKNSFFCRIIVINSEA